MTYEIYFNIYLKDKMNNLLSFPLYNVFDTSISYEDRKIIAPLIKADILRQYEGTEEAFKGRVKVVCNIIDGAADRENWIWIYSPGEPSNDDSWTILHYIVEGLREIAEETLNEVMGHGGLDYILNCREDILNFIPVRAVVA